MTDVVYTFIDGAAFDIAVNQLGAVFDATYLDINWQALSRNSQRIFYFDALPVTKAGDDPVLFKKKLDEKREKFAFLKRVPGMHVREGFTRLREQSSRPRIEQKGVDIALAVEVMKHVQRGNMDVARVFLNDLDFYPLLEALTDTRVVSELMYFPAKTSNDMLEVSDRAEPFDVYLFHSCLAQNIREKCNLEGYQDDLFDDGRKLATGSNRYGSVEVVASIRMNKFALIGSVAGGLYQTACNKLELLVAHYEMCAQTKTTWENQWIPNTKMELT